MNSGEFMVRVSPTPDSRDNIDPAAWYVLNITDEGMNLVIHKTYLELSEHIPVPEEPPVFDVLRAMM